MVPDAIDPLIFKVEELLTVNSNRCLPSNVILLFYYEMMH